MTNLSRAAFDANMPPGPLWVPADNQDFDLLLDGIADQKEITASFLKNLAYVRNADKTPWIEDLEKEYGIQYNSTVSDTDRINRLKVVERDKKNDGTACFLEKQLRDSGFDVYVHPNDSNIPTIFNSVWESYCGDSYCGDSLCGLGGGPEVANPADFIFTEWESYCGYSYCGDSLCGQTNDLLIVNGNIYFSPELIPGDKGYWPLVFFIGGLATRDTDGIITAIEQANIPISRTQEFIRLTVRYKPMHTWAGVVAKFS